VTRETFAKAGLEITRPGGVRAYLGALSGLEGVTVRFYPAAEIARELITGAIDIGVTGSDLIHEAAENGSENVLFVKPLEFGQADVVVAVPDAWIDVTHMADLADVASDFRSRHGRWLRIATKYVHLTRRFFADHGIAEYRIVESAGATEASPAAGAADLIVDITSSGETLAANQLRILEDGLIMKSEANLVVSKGADWTPMKKAQLEALLSIMGGIAPGISTQL
jgi:ATP phosphoribosyltransferase